MARRSLQFAWADGSEPAYGDLSGVEAALGARLPDAVREFFAAGRCVARRLPELSTDAARWRLYRESAECLLRDSRAEYRLAPNDVVFLAPYEYHYQFFFFRCDGCDDPPVFRFVEGERRPRQVAASFSEWAAGFLVELAQ